MISFPIALTLIVGIIVPMAAPLLGFLMFGNLIKENALRKKGGQYENKDYHTMYIVEILDIVE